MWKLPKMLPRMSHYRKIADLQMWDHLFDVYFGVIEFTHAAVLYYTSSSLRKACPKNSSLELNICLGRLFTSFSHPAKVVEEAVTNIENAARRVDQQSLADISQRQYCKFQCATLIPTLTVADAERNLHASQIKELQSCLRVADDETDTSKLLASAEKLLKDSFALSRRRAGLRNLNLQQITLEELEGQNEYVCWKEKPESAILVLSGYNFDNSTSGSGLCWLSPAALQVAATLPRKSFAYYTARKELGFTAGSPSTALSSLAIQLLSADNDLCAREHASIIRETKPHGNDIPMEKSAKLLKETIGSSTQSSIHIILDRVDLFPENQQHDLLLELVRIVRHSRNVIKILVVADSLIWRNYECLLSMSQGGFLVHSSENILFLKLRWHQQKKEVI